MIVRVFETNNQVVVTDQIIQVLTKEQITKVMVTGYSHPNHSGDVTSIGDGAQTIAANAVTNAKAAQMASKTYKGRTSAETGDAEDVAVATLKIDLALVKGDVGLGNVDNTSDVNKPISTATQIALDAKQELLTNSAGLAAALSDETGAGLAVFNNAPTIISPVITNLNPAADFTLIQNSVAVLKSVNAGGVVDTLFLKEGKVGIGTAAPGGLLGLKDVDTYIDRDASNNMTFTDVNAGTMTLTQLKSMRNIWINVSAQAEGNLTLADAANWGTRYSYISSIKFVTTSTNWSAWLCETSAFNTALITTRQIAANRNGNYDITIAREYNSDSNNVYIIYTDNVGAVTADILIVGEARRH